MEFAPSLETGVIRACTIALMLLATPLTLYAQSTHLLIVVGLGGDEEHGVLFNKWGAKLAGIATDKLGIPKENVTTLSGPQATREAVGKTFRTLAEQASADDTVVIVLFGFGTFDGRVAKFNLPGPDMTPDDFALLLARLRSKRVVFVNAASSSAPFVERLSGPGRVIIAAAQPGQHYATLFGGPFVDAFADPSADTDHNGKVSILEAFQYAKAQVAAQYTREGLMQLENPILDDNGDKEGSQDPGPQAKDGQAAAVLSLGSLNQQAVPADPKLRALYNERQDLERRIDSLKLMKASMDPAKYEQELEDLATQLALKTRQIKDAGGK